MKTFVPSVLIGTLLLFAPVVAMAYPSQAEMNRIRYATTVFNQMPSVIPGFVLRHARGIAVIPGALKAGFIFGGELGSGTWWRAFPMEDGLPRPSYR